MVVAADGGGDGGGGGYSALHSPPGKRYGS